MLKAFFYGAIRSVEGCKSNAGYMEEILTGKCCEQQINLTPRAQVPMQLSCLALGDFFSFEALLSKELLKKQGKAPKTLSKMQLMDF